MVILNIYLQKIALKIIAYTLSVFFVIDSIISYKIISSFKKETYKHEDNTEEISDMVKDKAEDILMKAESDMIVFSRKLRVKELKMQRKLHYRRKKIYDDLKSTPRELAEKLLIRRNKINIKLQESKEKIKISSEEFTKQVRERFKNKSLLKSRLIDAFPNLKIQDKINYKKDKKK